jgi:hypothetical protein
MVIARLDICVDERHAETGHLGTLDSVVRWESARRIVDHFDRCPSRDSLIHSIGFTAHSIAARRTISCLPVRRWLKILTATVVIAFGVIALTLFIAARSWAKADPIASTLGFPLAYAELILSLAALTMQTKADRNSRQLVQDHHDKSKSKRVSQNPKRSKTIATPTRAADDAGREPRFVATLKVARRTVVPAGGAGSGGCIITVTWAAGLVSSCLAILTFVAPALENGRESNQIEKPGSTVLPTGTTVSGEPTTPDPGTRPDPAFLVRQSRKDLVR